MQAFFQITAWFFLHALSYSKDHATGFGRVFLEKTAEGEGCDCKDWNWNGTDNLRFSHQRLCQHCQLVLCLMQPLLVCSVERTGSKWLPLSGKWTGTIFSSRAKNGACKGRRNCCYFWMQVLSPYEKGDSVGGHLYHSHGLLIIVDT